MFFTVRTGPLKPFNGNENNTVFQLKHVLTGTFIRMRTE